MSLKAQSLCLVAENHDDYEYLTYKFQDVLASWHSIVEHIKELFENPKQLRVWYSKEQLEGFLVFLESIEADIAKAKRMAGF